MILNKYPAHGAFSALAVLILMLSFSSNTSAHFGSKGPFGGTATCMTSKDSLVYVGTANGGVFESTTNQVTAWRARPVGLVSGKITALAHSGSYLFAGTADSGIFIFDGFVGSDRYWNRINSGLGNLKIKSLLALDSITLLAGTEGNGLYMTANKGASWTQVSNVQLNNATITGLLKAGSRLILLSETQGVFFSDDQGVSWNDFNDANTLNISGTNAFSYNSSSDELVVSNVAGLFIVPLASSTMAPAYSAAQTSLPMNTIVRGIANNGSDWYVATQTGVYTTASGNVNWMSMNNGLASLDATAVFAVQNRILAGVRNLGIYKAMAGINTWVETNLNFNNPVTHAMYTSGANLVIAATDRGVFVSKDLASTYVSSNTGLSDSLNVTDITMAGAALLASTKNAGVFVSNDSGKTWVAFNNGFSNLHITTLLYANQKRYAIDIIGNVFEAELLANSWTPIQTGLPNAMTPSSITYYSGKLILGTLSHGVFMKDQDSLTWMAMNSGLGNLSVTSVTASGNKIFAGTRGSGVFVSDFNTINWTATAPTSIPHTTMIGLDGNNIQAMASYAGFVYASYKGGLLATTDNGATWIAGGNQFNLPSFTDVRKISFVTTRVFVSTENNGLYSNSLSELPVLNDTLVLSRNLVIAGLAGLTIPVSVTSNRDWSIVSDQSWLNVSSDSGFRNGDFTLSIGANNGFTRTGIITVTAGTYVQTIQVSQDGVTSVSSLDALHKAVSIYPNPSNGSFIVDLQDAESSALAIDVYDVSGKLVKHVAVDSGMDVIPVSIDYLPGVYFVQVVTDQGSVTKRLAIN